MMSLSGEVANLVSLSDRFVLSKIKDLIICQLSIFAHTQFEDQGGGRIISEKMGYFYWVFSVG